MIINPQKEIFHNYRFSSLYGLKVSGPEIRHLPTNHPFDPYLWPTDDNLAHTVFLPKFGNYGIKLKENSQFKIFTLWPTMTPIWPMTHLFYNI